MTDTHGDAPPDSVALQSLVLVDDDELLLRTLSRVLSASFEVAAFNSGAAALERIQRGGVTVVLSDLDMPGLSGLELLRLIRGFDPDLPVVLLTGVPALESATKAIEYGVFRYLTKPFETSELVSTVTQASKLYRLARTKREALDLHGPAGASDRIGAEVTFRRALETLSMAFQPIVSARSRSVFGYEALLRSADPALPRPSHVLEAAEHLGALDELGRLVRRLSAEAMANAAPELLLFVNLHPRDLMDPELAAPNSPLTRIAHRVVLEVTERASLGGLDEVQARVAVLRQLGFRIAIDDLGAGYAGLTSFALLEPEIVKLDMTLTRGIDRSPVKKKLVASLSSLCREMGMTIVTEGVETTAERDTLLELGCDLLQGYLFARPAPAFPEVVW